MEGDLQLHSNKQTEWEATYQQLEAEKSTILESQIESETKSADLQASYDELEKSLQKEKQEKCVKVTSLEAQLENAEKQKESLRKELHETKEALRQSKHEFSELQKDYIDHQKNCEGFRQEVRHTIPYHAIPYYTILYHTIPYHTIPYHTIPHHTTPHHTTPHHTIPYHTIPYYTWCFNCYYNTLHYITLFTLSTGYGKTRNH